jgi:hypothetical protein
MTPKDCVTVLSYYIDQKLANTWGLKPAASEMPLHDLIYSEMPKLYDNLDIRAIFHGRSEGIEKAAEQLKLPQTEAYQGPCSIEEARAVKDILPQLNIKKPIFILNGNGFVAMGRNVPEVGDLVWNTYLEAKKKL